MDIIGNRYYVVVNTELGDVIVDGPFISSGTAESASVGWGEKTSVKLGHDVILPKNKRDDSFYGTYIMDNATLQAMMDETRKQSPQSKKRMAEMRAKVSRENAGRYVENGTWSYMQFEEWFQSAYPDVPSDQCSAMFMAHRSKYYYLGINAK